MTEIGDRYAPLPEVRRSRWPIVGSALIALAVAGAIVAIAVVLDEGDPKETVALPDDRPSREEPAEAFDPPAPDPPDAESPLAVGLTALITFTPNATEAQIGRIEEQWRAFEPLAGVVVLSADELEAEIGVGAPALAAFGDEADREAIEEFVCGFQGQPGVALAGVDDLCESGGPPPDGSTGGEPIRVVFALTVGADPDEATELRDDLEASGLFDRVEIVGEADDRGVDFVEAFGDAQDVGEICRLGQQYPGRFHVLNVELYGSNDCPAL